MLRKCALLVLVLFALVGVLQVSRAQGLDVATLETGILPLAAIIVAAAAVAISLLAMRGARRAQADFPRISRSMEMALRELGSRSDRGAASLDEFNRRIGEELRTLRSDANLHPDLLRTGSDDLREPASRMAPPLTDIPADAEPPTAETLQAVLAEAVSQGTLEVSLQPIISVSQSAATGFDVHAHVEQPEGTLALDISRLAEPMPGLDNAAFEVAMIRAAIAAGRRQLGTMSERMPFHVAISEALLGSGAEVEAVAGLARIHPALAASLIFSIPASLLGARGDVGERIDLLTATGFRLAVEGWDSDATDLRQAKSRGVHFLKLPANRLLDRERMRRKAPTGPELAEAAAAAGIAIIATGVIRDDDAVSLIDLGIDLMAGERFSGPRRIRSTAMREAALANL
jgi:cyclic-di-GMP phosphodiesterase, flagellum assembly factor TipF